MIAYSLAIFSAAEMKKPKPRRESKVRLLEVPAMMEWVVFQMRLNVLIANTLYPTVAKIDYSKYEATYTIPRLVPSPLPLLSSADYMYLLKNATKAKDPAVKIVIVETGPQSQMPRMVFCVSYHHLIELMLISQAIEAEKENNSDSDIERPKKKGRKTKVCG